MGIRWEEHFLEVKFELGLGRWGSGFKFMEHEVERALWEGKTYSMT